MSMYKYANMEAYIHYLSLFTITTVMFEKLE